MSSAHTTVLTLTDDAYQLEYDFAVMFTHTPGLRATRYNPPQDAELELVNWTLKEVRDISNWRNPSPIMFSYDTKAVVERWAYEVRSDEMKQKCFESLTP